MQALPQPQASQNRLDPRFGIDRRNSQQLGCHPHVLRRSQRLEQIMGLKDKANSLAQGNDLMLLQPVQLGAEDFEATFLHSTQSSKKRQ
jgi:hypothetical protein